MAQSGPHDPYTVLGVRPSDDRATIKRAYRTRIKTLHPDVSHGDADEFLLVQAAWRTLDAATRPTANTPAVTTVVTVSAPTPAPDVDVSRFARHQPFASQPGVTKQGLHLAATLTLTPGQAQAGGSRDIALTYPYYCTDCTGTGQHTNSAPCPSCRGAGKHHAGAQACSACHGTGTATTLCTSCNGRGYIPHTAVTMVHWPAGSEDADSWRVPRGGGPGHGRGAPGDLRITIAITEN